MATLGAQLVLLHRDPTEPRVLQLVLLIRSASQNERVYVEQCDIGSIRSIDAFATGWKSKARAGAVGDLEARIDGIVFLLPSTRKGSGLGSARPLPLDPVLRTSSSDSVRVVERNHYEYVLSRLALVKALESVLVKSARTSAVKVISLVSPFYAAGLPALDDLDWQTRRWPSWSPWLAEGQASTAWISASRRLQERFDERNRETGATGAGLFFLNVCEGFTRSWVDSLFSKSPLVPRALQIVLQALLFPLVFLCFKSSSDSIQTTLACLLEPVSRRDDVSKFTAGSKATRKGAAQDADAAKKPGGDDATIELLGGILYREGMPTRVRLLEQAPPGFEKKLFENVEQRVDSMRTETAKVDSRLKKEIDERLKKAKENVA